MWTASQVNKAGKTLRNWWNDPYTSAEEAAVQQALYVLIDYRATHRGSLIKATMGLRSVVRTEGCQVEVSQRLKRMTTIMEKLGKHPAMALVRMQDIGGCRAILANIDELRRVQKRLSRNRPPSKVDDYIENPRVSGYRGVHLIVQYDGRSIEIQLRTRVMHGWAIAVERLGGRIDEDLKSSLGPPQVLEWLGAISEAMALEERGNMVEGDLMERIAGLHREALPFLKGGSS